jgi:hypothetical protein
MKATFCVTLSLALATAPIVTRAEGPRSSQSERTAIADSVHVQPRAPHFDPRSAEEDDVQRKLIIFNEQQQMLEAMFDRRLMICRRC